MKLYYIAKSSDGKETVHDVTYGTKKNSRPFDTKENAMEYISSCKSFVRWTVKEVFDSYCFKKTMERMKKFYDDEDIEKIFAWLNPNYNTYSIRCFEILSGIELSRTMNKRMEQLKEYYGQKYIDYMNKKEQENKEKQERTYKAIEDKFIKGEDITNKEFITLCNKHNIDIPARTKGYINKYLVSINISGSYTKYGKTKSNNLRWIFSQLKDKFEKEEDECKELFDK